MLATALFGFAGKKCEKCCVLLFSEIAVLSFSHSICQLHFVQKCMSYLKLPEGAWTPCANLGTWKSWSSWGNHVSILKSNLETSGGLAVLATSKWSTGKRCPSWYLSGVRYFADTHLALERFRLAQHHVQAKIHQAHDNILFWCGVSLVGQHHFASKEGLVHSSPTFSLTQQLYLGCQRAMGAWSP